MAIVVGKFIFVFMEGGHLLIVLISYRTGRNLSHNSGTDSYTFLDLVLNG